MPGGASSCRLLTWDPQAAGFWLTREYFPQILDLDRRIFPTFEELRRAFGVIDSEPVLVPHDCTDGFLGAYWRRPEHYLRAEIRQSMSTFARIEGVDTGIARLKADLDTGAWHSRHGNLLDRDALDLGYRLVIAAL